MTINNQIEALSIRNTMVKPVNMTEFNNPFLLLSSTKALNELVVNTNPSSRAKVADIEPKTKFQKDPTGVPINVYTKDTATGAKVSQAVIKKARSTVASKFASSVIGAGLQNVITPKTRPSLKAREIKKRAETITAAAVARQKKAKATPVKATPVKAPHTGGGKAGGGKAGGGKAGKKKVGAPNRGIVAAKEAEATKKRLAKAKKALEKAGAGGMGGF